MLFLYRELLESDLDLTRLVRAHKPRRLPVVLTPEEVRAVLQRLEGSDALVAGLLYGSGLRLMEALRLRVHDLDFKRGELIVRVDSCPAISPKCDRFTGAIFQKAGAMSCFPLP